MLTRDQILSVSDSRRIEVQVPEWGGSVFVRSITAAERDAFESEQWDPDEKRMDFTNQRARYCALCVCDDRGSRLFTSDDAIALGAKSSAALDRVYNAAVKLNRADAESAVESEKN